jgi:hypothetical protein
MFFPNNDQHAWRYSDGSCCHDPQNGSTFCGSDHGECCGPTSSFCHSTTVNWTICPGGTVGTAPQAVNDFSFGCNIELYHDVNNCGGCGNKCSNVGGVPSCGATVNGQCSIACTSPNADCDGSVSNGCEVNLQSDVNHCGNCDTTCPNPAHAQARCNTGTCGFSCDFGYADCNPGIAGCETNYVSDPHNCGTDAGACNHVCPTTALHILTATCTFGVCGFSACEAGWGDCDGNTANGCETNLLGTDINNCGSAACGHQCPGSDAICTAGVCGHSGCAAGFQTCAATTCGTNTNTDVDHCGGCSGACSGQSITKACTGGKCTGTCSTGFADCDGDKLTNGCEVNIKIDTLNCGACGAACAVQHASPVCAGGVCGYIACLAGFSDCDGNTTNGCETQGRCPVDMATNPSDMAMAPKPIDMSVETSGADMAVTSNPMPSPSPSTMPTRGSKSGCDMAAGSPTTNALGPLLLLLVLAARVLRLFGSRRKPSDF